MRPPDFARNGFGIRFAYDSDDTDDLGVNEQFDLRRALRTGE